ncbi:AraC family transcriptional regulator [Paenibacillus sp. 598K]|uniref:AraC family transcriptional regulator n=1 Tax=Paenibacillus sp. 598K TaxID=1117987 RepID=UPI000FF94084|nr:AraC family transcriptional regulator [Paenibacillus sp. 598K]GBF71895.1 AraC family transcriptional regulator [Paenibacillus sp. 598K]
MTIPQLQASVGIDPAAEAHCRRLNSVDETSGRHTHDFFEVFLVLHGSVVHNINGERERLESNTLVFIRDRDVHCYERTEEGDCQLLNLSFYKRMLDDLFDYLGDGIPRALLLGREDPPAILLSQAETDELHARMGVLHSIERTDKSGMRAQTRALLAELFAHYLPRAAVASTAPAPRSPVESRVVSGMKGNGEASIAVAMNAAASAVAGVAAAASAQPPSWLTELTEAVERQAHYIEGVPALVRLSGKSHAYLCRAFKKHKAMTPVQYINGLRLADAERLLAATSLPIVEIGLECGFESTGHFYSLFKKQYGTPPHAYRLRQADA